MTIVRKYPHFCQPIKIGNVYFRNRMFGAPMGSSKEDMIYRKALG